MGKRKPYPSGRPAKKSVAAREEEVQGTIFFYMPKEKPYGVFCQWHTSPFSIPIASLQWLVDMAPSPPTPRTASSLILNLTTSIRTTSTESSTILSTHTVSNSTILFTCAEQSYMFCKAVYFSDANTARLILLTSDPKEQKKHGQKVKNFDFNEWGRVKSRVARVGNWYKYTDTKNKHMRSVLLGTQGREIAEAARRDRIWGIGYRSDEAETYRDSWGENLLGRCLMDVRDRIVEIDKKMAERDMGGNEDWEWDGLLGDEEAFEWSAGAEVPER
jgi:ribA/ribD-fused uncharacterized protein